MLSVREPHRIRRNRVLIGRIWLADGPSVGDRRRKALPAALHRGLVGASSLRLGCRSDTAGPSRCRVDPGPEQGNTRSVVSVSIAGDGEEQLHWYECSECGARIQATYAPVHCDLEMEPVGN